MSPVKHLTGICLIAILITWGEVTASEELIAQQASNFRQPRHLQSKLCFKFGFCGNHGHGGYQGGHQGGHQGGYEGGHGGYHGYPAINIGISQSQASSSAGGGGFGSGYYPNNYQFNGHPGGYNGYNGGFNRPGNFGNGFGSYNNQFNGNYYGGKPQGGYGFQGPFGNFYDEGDSDVKLVYENQEERSAKSKN